MRTTVLGATLAMLVGVAAVSAAQTAPQPPVDSNWRPLLGCWQMLNESVADESDVSAEEIAGGRSPRQSRVNNGTRVCVEPGNTPSAVRMITLVGDRPALEETVTADGANHPMVDAECKGTKRSEWSTLGARLFTSAEISCGEQAPRKVSSLTMITAGPKWVDVQMIEIGTRKSIRVRRFAKADTQRTVASGASPTGETRWTLADVKEASKKLSPETVQAALVELGEGFDLKGKQLIELDRAGVPSSVIDLMVALTYPNRFIVERPSMSGGSYGGSMGGGFGGFSGLSGSWPWISDQYFWPSYYSPFAYRYWGYNDPYYVPNSGYVIVNPPGAGVGGGGSTGPVATGSGRVVDGMGYTRVRAREADPIRSDFSSGGTNSTASSSGNGGSSNSGGSSGVSSGGGYSSGGSSGGDGGRTAVPRPPGGN